MTDLTALTLAQARDALRKKQFSALELADAHLAAIEKARALNAFVLETPDRARDMARAADARLAKGEGGPLEGLPLGIKDLFCTDGVRTTACSHILDNFVPTYESTVTANLWRDGAVLLGKTNNDEFAMGSSNETSYFGPVVSPWRRRGVGRQACARRLFGRLGGGGGGQSLRRRDRHRHRRLDPAAGGVFRHRRHQADLRPLLALGHRGVRVVARSGRAVCAHGARLRDPAALDGRATTRRIRPASICRCPTTRKPSAARSRACASAFRRNTGWPAWPPEIEALWQQGAQWLKDAGAELVDISLPHTKYALPAYYIVAPAEASSNLARYDGVRYGLRVAGRDIIDMYETTRAAGFGKEVRRRIMIGTYVLSAGYYDAYYLRAQKVRTLIKRDFESCFADGIHAILTPATPSAAFGIGEKGRADPIEMYLNDVFTVTVNMAGLPGISVPSGLDGQGLPLGLQLIGRPFDEETLFSWAQ